MGSQLCPLAAITYKTEEPRAKNMILGPGRRTYETTP